MPIRPEMKALYPANWKEIRAKILLRAGNRCEKCRRPNGVSVLVYPDGAWTLYQWETAEDAVCRDENGEIVGCRSKAKHFDWNGQFRVTKTILTISHQDHDPRNNDPSNLRALCQRCHLTHDAKEHASNARRTRARKAGLLDLVGLR